MNRWQIWAPHATTLEVLVNGRPRAAEALGNGYFSAEPPPAEADYQFRIDGRVRPNPRARCQPQGVDGPSRWVVDEFAWDDHGFRAAPLSAALIYELHIGTFSAEGTFLGAVAHLAQLAQLGVTHVELMPVATFPGQRGWGYDGVALFAPQRSYGTTKDLKRLVASCHELGIGVILDVVYNHLGPDGNYLAEFGPYLSTRHSTAWGAAMNLDGAHSDEVRKFFLDNAKMWLRDYHIDGLRLDAVHALYDHSALHLLEELAIEVEALSAALGKPLVLIAESDLNDPRLVQNRAAGGYGLDAQWSDDFHHALHAALTGERSGYYADFGTLSDIARALRDGYVYAGRYSQFRGRRHGRSLAEISGQHLIGYLQTHDQIGNRARGERIGHLVSPGRLRIGAALVFMAPFVPMIFQGEEWNASTPFQYFTDHRDPQLAEAVRSGRRAEFAAFGWDPDAVPDPQAEATFQASVLDWSERDRAPHTAVLTFYRELARLRAGAPELRDGRRDRVQVECDEASGAIRVQRGATTFVANLGKQAISVAQPAGAVVLSFPEPPAQQGEQLRLMPDSCSLWRSTGGT